MIWELAHYTALSRNLLSYLAAEPIEDPWAAIAERRASRGAEFLAMARTAIFETPANPYHRMFQAAGCGYEDLEAAVERDGLEAALYKLYEAGVYLTHDEFKGHTPIARQGFELPGGSEQFRNPLTGSGFESSSSGSRSRKRTAMTKSFAFRRFREGFDRVMFPALGLDDAAVVVIHPAPPSVVGINRCCNASRRGQPAEAWFTLGGKGAEALHYQPLTHLLALVARSGGVRIPSPVFLPTNDFSPAAECIARLRRQGKPVLVDAMVSNAVRTCAAALEQGHDISGASFLVAGEALTNPKRAVIEQAGCRVFATYIISEMGFLGVACEQMPKDNCVHLMDDLVAVISRPRRVPMCDFEVDSLLFTSAWSQAPFALVNADMGDAGTLGAAPCDCGLSKLGYRRQLSHIFSYSKLTGQGVTLLGNDVLPLLEEQLPARFGGCPGDYQLVEREAGAQTSMELRVNPRLAADTVAVSRFFLDRLARLWGGSLGRRAWTETGGMTVVAAEPLMTKTGKVLPLHLLGFGGGE